MNSAADPDRSIRFLGLSGARTQTSIRAVLWTLLAVVLATGVAAADGDLDVLLLIGEKDIPGETAAQAFGRHIDAGHFRVVTRELKKLNPDEIGDDQLDDLAAIARAARHRARRWESAAIHNKGALALLEAIYGLAEQVRKRKGEASADVHLAYANALVARSLEKINRKDSVPFKQSFRAASEACLDGLAAEAVRAEDCAIEAAQLIRVGVHRAPDRHAALDHAEAALDKVTTQSLRVQAERGQVLLARAHALLAGRKRGAAKDAVLKGLAEVAAGKDASVAQAVGAYNDLLGAALANKWASGEQAFITESRERGGFRLEVPTGSLWAFGNERDLKGKGRLLVERRQPDGAWIELGLASFDKDLGYGKGDVPGGKPKAILQLTKQVWSAKMRKPKSGKQGKKGLPPGFSFADGYTLSGRSTTGVPTTIFAWACKSPDMTYVFSARIEGRIAKKLPPQVASILASIQPK